MCLKYTLQETADCVSRQREAAMTPSHHVFLIDFDSRVCVCLTGAPQPLSEGTSASRSAQTPLVPSSRRLLRTSLTSCMKEQVAENLSGDHCQDAGASLITDEAYIKQKTMMGPLPKTGHLRGPALQNTVCSSLTDSLKRWIRRLVSCVRTE